MQWRDFEEIETSISKKLIPLLLLNEAHYVAYYKSGGIDFVLLNVLFRDQRYKRLKVVAGGRSSSSCKVRSNKP